MWPLADTGQQGSISDVALKFEEGIPTFAGTDESKTEASKVDAPSAYMMNPACEDVA